MTNDLLHCFSNIKESFYALILISKGTERILKLCSNEIKLSLH